ncbi:Uncharacterised protein [Mycobacterium tuberculosis]|nr:Uncharacterised protein [Mycobacterium tuberculosis]
MRDRRFDRAHFSERCHHRRKRGQLDVDDGPSDVVERFDDIGQHRRGVLVKRRRLRPVHPDTRNPCQGEVGGIVRNGLRRARGIVDIGSRYDTEQYRRIVSAAGDRPDVVVACRKFDDAVTADPAPRRFDPGDAAHARRKANRPPGVRPDRAEAQSRRGGHAAAARGHARPRCRVPGIDRGRQTGVIAEIGPLRHGQLADDHRAGRAQPRDNRRVVCRAKVTKDGGAGRGRGVDRVAEILHADRYAVQDTLVVAARDVGVGGTCRR